MAYSEADISNAMALLDANGGNLSKTSRETGINRDTLRRWKKDNVPGGDVESVREKTTEKKRELADKLEEIANKVMDSMLDREMDSVSFKEGMTGAGIAIDKMRLLRGAGDDAKSGLDDFINAMRS